jgi:hypothetical protein
MEVQSTQPIEAPKKHTAKIVKWVTMFAIVVVLNLFFNYTINLLYHAPEYNDFCPSELYNKAYVDKDSCLSDGGQWTETVNPPDFNANTKVATPVTPSITGYCNPTFTCQKDYDEAQKLYNRNVFVILFVLGVLSIVVGAFTTNIQVISLGLSFGGILSIVIGSIRYWSNMQDWLRVIVLALALVVLIWIGIKKLKD